MSCARLRIAAFRVLFAAVLLLPLPADAAAKRNANLKVFAASSLTECFNEIATRFEKAHPHASVELNFAGTPTLRTQIEQGASADVFASADRTHTAALEQQKLLPSSTIFARNELVLVAPAGNEKLSGFAELAGPDVKIVLADKTVPAGRYAEEVLHKIEAAGIGGGEFAARVKRNLVSRETNVRAVLSKVRLGEADAGFVYRTDAAAAAGKIRVIEIPDSLNAIAEYSIGVLSRSISLPLANEFMAMVVSGEGQAILREHGFQP
jgi:molybdate transport system substrate-binding protein